MKYITAKFVKFLSIGLVFGAASLAQAGEVSTAQLNEDAMAGQQFSVALESVQTDRLNKSFNKYLPSVIDGNGPAKRKAVLSEAKEITGNRTQEKNMTPKADDSNVLDLRRLAGLN